MKHRIIVYFYFFVCICIGTSICTNLEAADNNAGKEDHSPLIYYHWVNENYLLLWKDVNEEPVKAVFVIKENTWDLPPGTLSDKKWHGVLKDCIPKDYIKEIPTGKEVWRVFLNYIHEEKRPDNNKMELKFPDVSFYVQSFPENKKKLIFITGSELFGFSRTTINFKTFDPRITGLLQLKDLKVFKESLNLEIEKGKEWDFWNVWVKQIIESNDPLFYNYRTKDGKTQWLWAEKVESKDLITGLRSQPLKPKIKIEKVTVTKPVPVYLKELIYNNVNLIIIGVVFFLLLCLYVIIGLRIRRLKSIPVENIKILFDNLRKEDKQIVEDMQDLVQKKETLLSNFDKKLGFFSEENQVLQLGEGVMEYYQTLDKNEKNQDPKTWIEGELRDLNNYRKVTVPKLKEQRDKLDEERKELSSENEKISNEMRNYYNVGGKNLAERWAAVVNLINNQNKLIQSQMKVAKEMTHHHKAEGNDLSEKWTSIENLINTQKDLIQTRERDMEKLQQHHQAEIAKFNIDEIRWKQINDDLEKIESLNQMLWNSQRDIQNNSPGKSPEIAAIVSFLIYYSLFHLKEAVYHDQKRKKDMMLSNLLVITGKMKERHDVLNNKLFEGFKIANDKIPRDFPGSKIEEFESSTSVHKNAYLFQNLLGRLRDLSNSRLNFKPFYFDLDKDGKVHIAK